ncbi:MAG: aminotransferase class IV [Pseudonocardiales bacterium]|nr:aminotransferase class IV [Pseudonocardiales bacterium]
MAHTASISQLQIPPWALVNGELVRYEDVRIHISAEALTRALSVFEGLKGYWNTAGDVFAVRSPRQHYNRLCRSAALLHIPISFTYDDFVAGLVKLGGQLLVPDRDLWFRTTLYVTKGHWGEGTAADLIVTAFMQQKRDPHPMRLGVSTWRRGADVVLPARVKCSANYIGGRLARIEACRLGYDDAVLLNEAGRVAEVTGACILIVDKGRIISPPTSEGCLDSITVAALEQVSRELGLAFERRPIERTELLTADECAVAGTITELTLVDEVDGFRFEQSGLLSQVRQRYLGIMRGKSALPGIDLVPLIDKADLSGSRAEDRDECPTVAAAAG